METDKALELLENYNKALKIGDFFTATLIFTMLKNNGYELEVKK